jgi:hypothetical protein
MADEQDPTDPGSLAPADSAPATDEPAPDPPPPEPAPLPDLDLDFEFRGGGAAETKDREFIEGGSDD